MSAIRYPNELNVWHEGMAQGQRSWVLDDGAIRSEVIFRGSDVTLGRYSVSPWSSVWTTGDIIRGGPLLAFARTPVEIEQRDREPIVADHTCAVLHNAKSEYRRRLIDARGEKTLWLSLTPETISDILGVSLDDPSHPFERSSAPVSGESYLLCHAVARRVASGEPVDRIEIEQMLLRVADDVLSGSGVASGGGVRRESTRRAHAHAAFEMRRFIGEGFRRALSLEDVARSVFLSVFHAARVFKQQTGMTIHENLQTLRLREALERMSEGEEKLAEVARGVGFSSHAHLTDAFRSHFGVAPSLVRQDPMAAARLVLAGG